MLMSIPKTMQLIYNHKAIKINGVGKRFLVGIDEFLEMNLPEIYRENEMLKKLKNPGYELRCDEILREIGFYYDNYHAKYKKSFEEIDLNKCEFKKNDKNNPLGIFLFTSLVGFYYGQTGSRRKINYRKMLIT